MTCHPPVTTVAPRYDLYGILLLYFFCRRRRPKHWQFPRTNHRSSSRRGIWSDKFSMHIREILPGQRTFSQHVPHIAPLAGDRSASDVNVGVSVKLVCVCGRNGHLETESRALKSTRMVLTVATVLQSIPSVHPILTPRIHQFPPSHLSSTQEFPRYIFFCRLNGSISRSRLLQHPFS